MMRIVLVSLSLLLFIAFAADSADRIFNRMPTRFSVELVRAKGLASALDPGAAEPPAFDLLVHVNNGRYYNLWDGGSDVVVSYAGVPLARGRTPAIYVEANNALTLAANATSSGGVGIPEDLFRLMSEERGSGAARLHVDLWLGSGLFTCTVDLDGEHRVSTTCDNPSVIYSS
ncbi:hypothetical protein U9M48_026572 [Paspalum notatum var. saurae]|uniref:Late embryogenesis abundant protein LEA-2 subgroup domain-containing protein n=1 Tax=Paspalum notatum var. saurae TaxID=547442 RepID=A0AAQ3TT27_PASNO